MGYYVTIRFVAWSKVRWSFDWRRFRGIGWDDLEWSSLNGSESLLSADDGKEAGYWEDHCTAIGSQPKDPHYKVLGFWKTISLEGNFLHDETNALSKYPVALDLIGWRKSKNGVETCINGQTNFKSTTSPTTWTAPPTSSSMNRFNCPTLVNTPYVLRYSFCLALCAMRRCTAGTLGVWANTLANKPPNCENWRKNTREKRRWGAKSWDPTAENGRPVSSASSRSCGAIPSPKSEKTGFSLLCSVASWLCLATLWITVSACAIQVMLFLLLFIDGTKVLFWINSSHVDVSRLGDSSGRTLPSMDCFACFPRPVFGWICLFTCPSSDRYCRYRRK